VLFCVFCGAVIEQGKSLELSAMLRFNLFCVLLPAGFFVIRNCDQKLIAYTNDFIYYHLE